MSKVIKLKPGAAPGAGKAAQGTVRRILLVEDDANDAELMRAYLAGACGEGAEVLHARTLAEGLALQQSNDISLTLLDLDLPDSSGFHTLERMRAVAAGPVVVVSGNAHADLVEEALKRRAYDVIRKHELNASTLQRVLRLAGMHQEAGRTLRATEGRFRALLDNSAEALVLLEGGGRIEYASASLRRVLGYESADVIGRTGLSFVHAEDREKVQNAFVQLSSAAGANAVLRVRCTHKDGGERLLEASLANRLADPDVAGMVCSFRDLAREEEQRARFQATFENSAVGLAHVDTDGRMLIVNQRLCELLGYSRDELVGRTVREFSHPEDLDSSAELRAQLRAGRIPQFIMRKRYLHKDASVLWVQLTVSLERDAHGVPLYDVAAFEDVSESMRAAERSERLGRMYAALSATNEAILKTADAQTLYRRVCELLVEHGGLKLVAVRLVDRSTGWMEAVAHAGEPAAYLAKAGVSVDPEMPNAHGAAGRAVREGRTVVANDYLGDPTLAQWHGLARDSGIAATVSIPLRRGGTVIGLISMFAAESNWFDQELVGLAERMVENVSFALDNIDHEVQRAQAEQALRQSEARFRSLAELASDWYWEQDEAYRFTRFDGGHGDEKWGGDQSRALGLRRWEIPGLTPLGISWDEHRKVLEARQPFRGFEYQRVTEDGARRYVTTSGEPVYDADGRFIGYRGTATDITERKLAERRLRLEHQVTRQLAEAPDAAGGLEGAIRIICETEGWHCGRYYEVDEKAGLLRYRHSWSVDDAEMHRFIDATAAITHEPGEGVRGAVWQTGAPMWVADVREDPRVSESVRSLIGEVRGAFVVPVSAGSKVIGVLSVAGRVMREPDERLLRAMGVIGSQIGQFLQRMRGDEALRASEERFRSLTELSSDWYWEQDAEFRFTSVSIEPESPVFGPRPSVIGKARWELPLTPLSTGWAQHRETLQAQGAFRDFEFSYADADGKSRYVSASGYPMHDAAGRFQGYRGIGRDITLRKQSENALRRFRAALDISADSIFLVDVDAMRVIDCNDAAGRNLGYERAELLGAEVTILFADRTREQMRAQFEQLLERDDGEELARTHHCRKDGSLVPVEVTRRVLRTPEGRYIVSVARDLTERLRSEERLSSSHERFEIVSRATNDVVWDWNLVTNGVWWNENFQKLFGYEPREIGAYADSWRARIHSEDVGRIKAQVDAAIASGAKAWTGEYRVRRKDGSYADVYDRGLVMHDAAGRAVRMIGAIMDISERKHAEGRMRVHAERQAAIARFGQFALGRRSIEELYAEAARALRCEGVDAVCVLEMFTEQGEYLVRAAQGEGPHDSLGQRGAISPDSVWLEILRENAPRIAGREYLSTRPLDRPWRAWLRTMGSAVYVPVRDDDRPIAMLSVYAVAEHAFGVEDVRFVEALGHVLSTALQRQKAEARLAHLAQFDALTGLPNRTVLQDRLGQNIVQSRRRQLHAGVLFVDLDRFKLVNDTLGHHQGDEMIRQVGQRLLSCVRPGDTVGRISGDEFAVVLADMARPDDAALVAQKILETLATPFNLGGDEAYVTASIGIAAYPGDGDDAETLLKNADMAMYRAKESARNSYCFFTAEMNQRSLAKAQLNADLRHALERKEFALHYQPKIDLADGTLCGLEALLRWNHPVRGLVSPMEFVPALEDSGLIIPVGEWVIGEACTQIRRWEQTGLVPVPVAVNLSAKQFMRRDLDDTITSALAASGVPARLLELEITESCLMDNPEEAVRALHALREAGLKISVDDFGTGYSSLAYLARFPLSALKIDRAFVRNVHLESNDAAIVRAVIDLANALKLLVVAEGVETEQQAAFLRRHGCHQGQGYLFSRPVPADQVDGLLRAGRATLAR